MDLKKIADGLRLIADGLDDTAREETTKPARDTKPRESAAKTKEKEQPEAKPEPKAKAPEPDTAASSEEVPVEAVIKVLQKVAKACGRSTIDTILGDFNVTKVSDLSAGDYADVITLAENALEKV
jgi:outer membrane biosynthesis protein TonB